MTASAATAFSWFPLKIAEVLLRQQAWCLAYLFALSIRHVPQVLLDPLESFQALHHYVEGTAAKIRVLHRHLGVNQVSVIGKQRAKPGVNAEQQLQSLLLLV